MTFPVFFGISPPKIRKSHGYICTVSLLLSSLSRHRAASSQRHYRRCMDFRVQWLCMRLHFRSSSMTSIPNSRNADSASRKEESIRYVHFRTPEHQTIAGELHRGIRDGTYSEEYVPDEAIQRQTATLRSGRYTSHLAIPISALICRTSSPEQIAGFQQMHGIVQVSFANIYR